MRVVSVAMFMATLIGCSAAPVHNNANSSADQPASDAAVAAGNATAAANSAAPAMEAVAAYLRQYGPRWTAGQPVTPAEVRAMLAARGARATVQTLADPDTNNRWETVVRGIAMGEQPWLDLVPQLRNGTDAGTTDDIVIALSDAVITNPTAALRLFVPQPTDAENFCTDNGFETPAEQTRAYFAAAIAAVESVGAPELQSIKAACLARLRATRPAS
jgi:hypothetical protein